MDTVLNTVISGIFLLINAVLSSVIAAVVTRKKKRSADEEAVANGVQCLLRAEIIRAHEKYSQKKFCPIYAKESLTRAYAAYHALGGNDVATDLYRQIMDLPESEVKNEN